MVVLSERAQDSVDRGFTPEMLFRWERDPAVLQELDARPVVIACR